MFMLYQRVMHEEYQYNIYYAQNLTTLSTYKIIIGEHCGVILFVVF